MLNALCRGQGLQAARKHLASRVARFKTNVARRRLSTASWRCSELTIRDVASSAKDSRRYFELLMPLCVCLILFIARSGARDVSRRRKWMTYVDATDALEAEQAFRGIQRNLEPGRFP